MDIAPRLADHRLSTSIWQAPLVPAALAVTAGIVVDRYASVPLAGSLMFFAVSFLAWLATFRRHSRLALVNLLLAAASVGAAYHHYSLNFYPADHIGRYAGDEPRIAKVRGIVADETTVTRGIHGDPLRSFDSLDRSTTIMEVSECVVGHEWSSTSGNVRLIVSGSRERLPVGTSIEVVGRLSMPETPENPGEFDRAAALRDQRILALMVVEHADGAIKQVATGQVHSVRVWLGLIRNWGRAKLNQYLPPDTSSVAVALLLGDGSAMDRAEWDKYQRTGVMHVLVVSGQHLVVIAAFLWSTLRFTLIRPRYAAVVVALVLLGYAALTGGRPPVVRAAVIVIVFCGALWFRRLPQLANGLALGWLIIVALNPASVFDSGCQLSFLSVAILYWGTSRWFQTEADPLDQLVDEARPWWERWLRFVVRQIALSYAVTFAVWLAIAPLFIYRYHLVSPVALVIGPPVVLFASIALIAGFLLLLAATFSLSLASLFAAITHLSIAVCEWLVNVADRFPFGHFYVSGVTELWLWVLYIGLLAFLLMPSWQRRWRWVAVAGALWLCIGLIPTASERDSDELRCTFLAVGHGGCTIMETPDGRVLLYDAGAMTGPEVTQRQIAPFLWSRGITRIDEIFLSHADLDHFNGLPALLDRFSIAQATCTPTFADKRSPGVGATLEALRRHGVPLRIVKAGDRLQAGEVGMTVLHPTPHGPTGAENVRSMVMRVEYGGHGMLLTGDVEGPGLEQVVNLPPPRTDVLMAPHHGSRAGSSIEDYHRAELISGTKPSLIVASQGRPRGRARNDDPYTMSGVPYLGTWPHGAITIRFRRGEFSVETFRTGLRFKGPNQSGLAKNQ